MLIPQQAIALDAEGPPQTSSYFVSSVIIYTTQWLGDTSYGRHSWCSYWRSETPNDKGNDPRQKEDSSTASWLQRMQVPANTDTDTTSSSREVNLIERWSLVWT